ncbi:MULTISPECIES: hypothetical protein [Leptolyngbya]|uniref:Uncharacterized protein n=1 Tax=Leptolyngbya boryana CZ1 TaxID=3060204 RepID=A0AA96WSP2_LEPBY|nr:MULTISPECIES: hypothetical protein [Leptolyngbya]MBD1857825.1 hypothetical protein [Leptolyngbya sp. FACHB-1624]MBD2371198.1 hypothetical protein [Leptolyngbya sp. FACHB-161]MBD2377655.1 hypothetical protein [Leptolyngbya sp. FACHB-238]MBD2402107.1 hypothetical protein [Leptolyngbya sp. FACHB-239]MBD2408627.1 hypothetical protein [Leptolyngbya sp. FACHB-402]
MTSFALTNKNTGAQNHTNLGGFWLKWFLKNRQPQATSRQMTIGIQRVNFDQASSGGKELRMLHPDEE